jgi:hypothetical protein
MMVINEAGRLLALPRKEQATQLAQLPTAEERAYQLMLLAMQGVPVIDAGLPGDQYIAGTALVCEDEEV